MVFFSLFLQLPILRRWSQESYQPSETNKTRKTEKTNKTQQSSKPGEPENSKIGSLCGFTNLLENVRAREEKSILDLLIYRVHFDNRRLIEVCSTVVRSLSASTRVVFGPVANRFGGILGLKWVEIFWSRLFYRGGIYSDVKGSVCVLF